MISFRSISLLTIAAGLAFSAEASGGRATRLVPLSESPQVRTRLAAPSSGAASESVAAFPPFRVRLRDWAGAPIKRARIEWKCIAAPPIACDIGQAFSITDELGETVLNQVGPSQPTWKDRFARANGALVSGGDGPVVIEASYRTEVVRFSLVVGPHSVKPVSGDNQRAVRSPSGEAPILFAPMTVEVRNARGGLVRDTRVRFSCRSPTGMDCRIHPGDAHPKEATVQTDRDGQATLNLLSGSSLSAANQIGKVLVSAATTSTSEEATFETTIEPAETNLLVLSGDGQRAPRLWEAETFTPVARFAPLTVLLINKTNQPISDASISWRPANGAGMGCDLGPNSSVATTKTDASGRSTLPSARCIYADGSLDIVAATQGADARFHLTVGGPRPPANVLSIVSGDQQRRKLGPLRLVSPFDPLVVKLTDPQGLPLVGAPIRYTCTKCLFGMYSNADRTTTGADGTATLAGMSRPDLRVNVGGTGTIGAVVGADNADPISFSLVIE